MSEEDADTSATPSSRTAHRPWLSWLGRVARDEDSALGALQAYRALSHAERDALVSALEEDSREIGEALELMLVPFLGAETEPTRKGRLVALLKADLSERKAFTRMCEDGWSCIVRFPHFGWRFSLPHRLANPPRIEALACEARDHELRADGYETGIYDDVIDELALRVFRRGVQTGHAPSVFEPFAHLFGALRDVG